MSNCVEHLPCKTTKEDYLKKIQQTMPQGVVWDFDDVREYPKFWQTIADLFSTLSNYLCDVLNEWYPCSTQDLLRRHADLWDYPTECIGYPTTTAKLCEWIELSNSNCVHSSVGFIRALMDFLDIECVTVEEKLPISSQTGEGCNQTGLECSTTCSDPQAELIFNVDMSCFTDVETSMEAKGTNCEETGCDPCEEVTGYALGNETATGNCCNSTGCDECAALVPELDCLVRRFVPAHVNVIYNEI